ncbi:MAG: hypothetical protein LBP22_05090 [Deltaproteobacteria bacterium]|nr:hypothetical protein [Deltaproteobacteria bacterium]
MKSSTVIFGRIFLWALFASAGALILFFILINLRGDALDKSLAEAHLTWTLADRMSDLGWEAAESLFRLPSLTQDALWLEDEAGGTVLGLPNPLFSLAQRVKLPVKNSFGNLTLWENGQNILIKAKVSLDNKTFWLLRLQTATQPLSQGEIIFFGFFSFLASGSAFGCILAKRAVNPIIKMSKEIVPLTKGDHNLRISLPSDPILSSLGADINILVRTIGRLNDQNMFLSQALSYCRTYLANGLLMSHLTETAAQPGTLPREPEKLDRFLSDSLLIYKLDTQPEAFKLEPVTLSALTFELVCRYRDLGREKGWTLNSQVGSDLVIRANYELAYLMVADLLELAALGSPEPVNLDLKRSRENILLSVDYSHPYLSSEALEELFSPDFHLPPEQGVNGEKPPLTLAVVRRIAELFKAEVKAENAPRPDGNSLRLHFLFPDLGHFPYPAAD